MRRENVIMGSKKDRTQEISISGPWIIEMLGFSDYKSIESVLKQIRIAIITTYSDWEEANVSLLINAQN